MDGNGSMNNRDWGFYEPPAAIRGYLGLQLMSGGQEKPIPGGRAHPVMMSNNNIELFNHMPINVGPFHHRGGGVSESPMPMDYIRESWINNREKYFGGVPSNDHHHQQQQQQQHFSSFSILPETSRGQEMQMLQIDDPLKEEEGITQLDDIDAERDIMGPATKRPGCKIQKSPKAKKSKKSARSPKDDGSVSGQRARLPKKSMEMVINGVEMDVSSIPIPICSCTGALQQCYRWGSGGWQSACCTTGMSTYPLPMSTKRRGARIAGRKMSIGAFKKVLEKLASEGYDFSNPIDLRTYWAKHGTNKFVTIR